MTAAAKVAGVVRLTAEQLGMMPPPWYVVRTEPTGAPLARFVDLHRARRQQARHAAGRVLASSPRRSRARRP